MNTIGKVEAMIASYNSFAQPQQAREVYADNASGRPAEKFEDALSVAISKEARRLAHVHRVDAGQVKVNKLPGGMVNYSVQVSRAINVAV